MQGQREALGRGTWAPHQGPGQIGRRRQETLIGEPRIGGLGLGQSVRGAHMRPDSITRAPRQDRTVSRCGQQGALGMAGPGGSGARWRYMLEALASEKTLPLP